VSDPVGGQALIARLLMKHRTELLAYLLASVRHPHDAEDLLQDVSIAASTSWEQYRPDSPFLPWAREIARRRVLNYGKRQGKRLTLLEPEVLESLDRAAAETEEPLDPRRAALRSCLGEVGGTARRVLELRYGDGADVGRIAGEIRKTVQAAYAILKRTKRAVRDCVSRRLASEGLR
jgi:RNA polymerase sigma-70 factor (ECF subfamily)